MRTSSSRALGGSKLTSVMVSTSFSKHTAAFMGAPDSEGNSERGDDGRTSELHRLELLELLQPVPAQLTAMSGLSVATERRQRIEAASVDVHLTGAHPSSHPLRPLHILRPDATGEAVDGAVRDADRVVLVVVRHDGEHGAENLFLRDGHLRRDVREDGGLHVVALREALGLLGTASDELRALTDALLDVLADTRALRVGA